MFRYYKIMIRKERLQKKGILHFHALHNAEVFIGVYLLATFWNYPIFISIFWGMVLHIILDTINSIRFKVLFIRAYSAVEYLIRKKLMLRKGINPDIFYKEIFESSEK